MAAMVPQVKMMRISTAQCTPRKGIRSKWEEKRREKRTEAKGEGREKGKRKRYTEREQRKRKKSETGIEPIKEGIVKMLG
jgi:hypothetical protein